jgi:putative hemin transport protein
MNIETVIESKDLVERWSSLRRVEPRLAQWDGAERLGVTEAELVAAHVGRSAVRLAKDWELALKWLGALGPATGLTRGPHAVLEQQGTYARVQIEGTRATVVGGGISLRALLPRWHVAFAVTYETAQGERRSLQFFDTNGTAIHKVFLSDEGDGLQFDHLVDVLESDDQSPTEDIAPSTRRILRRREHDVDVEGVRAGWELLGSALDLQGLIDSLGTTRSQAFHLVGPGLAERLVASSYQDLLAEAEASDLPVAITVANAAVAQTHDGPVRVVDRGADWTKVAGPDFNLHIGDARIASAWLVRGLNRNGLGPHVEVHDEQGDLVLCLAIPGDAGSRRERRWRRIVGTLERGPDTTRVCRDIARHVR